MSNPNAVENKIVQLEANLRRERDQGRRAMDLAQERLRLAAEEWEHIRQQTVQDDHRTLIPQEERAVQDLHAAVARLEQEVQFQHQQLLQKSQKLETLQSERGRQASHRQATMENVRLVVRRERQGMDNNMNVSLSMSDITELVALPHVWDRVVQHKTPALPTILPEPATPEPSTDMPPPQRIPQRH